MCEVPFLHVVQPPVGQRLFKLRQQRLHQLRAARRH
jgi:hypothetical protein